MTPGRNRVLSFAALIAIAILLCSALQAAAPRNVIEKFVQPPYRLGEPAGKPGVWSLQNAGGADAGYVFETEPLAPLPGFSGAPINAIVLIDLEGRFIDVKLLAHNEPIFVSGLGEAAFHRFFEQYGGLSSASSLAVGVPYGDKDDASSLVYLDGVTKATASVRIAHESILAATLAVVRENLRGIATGPPAFPNRNYRPDLNWQDLVDRGLAKRFRVSNAEIQAKFADTLWETDDPVALASPDSAYLDLWIVDLGPPAIARAALAPRTYDELQEFLRISPDDEPILLIDAGRHGLVSEAFVRNTSPDWLSASQDGLPMALRDADILVELQENVPAGAAMILRIDRRLGFDPTRPWQLDVLAVRAHGNFYPEIGTKTLSTQHQTDVQFFSRPETVIPRPAWLEAIANRQADLILLAPFLVVLLLALGPGMYRLADMRHYTAMRLSILAVVIGFVGWWGQGQLSIVTVLGVLRTLSEAGSFAFLLYDPFSLAVWGATLIGFVLWGRGLFCGWLCPFGAMQEFAHNLGRRLKLPQIHPNATWDARLKYLKYVALGGLLILVFAAPETIDTAAEIEPFKTAVTVYFQREWYFVAYAAGWLVLSLFLFKGFCRYVCPLGAVMALGGLLRLQRWIPRRAACGTPCQLCRVRCEYGAIKKSGAISYSECFQCLDCVTIHNDRRQCVPLILADKKRAI